MQGYLKARSKASYIGQRYPIDVPNGNRLDDHSAVSYLLGIYTTSRNPKPCVKNPCEHMRLDIFEMSLVTTKNFPDPQYGIAPVNRAQNRIRGGETQPRIIWLDCQAFPIGAGLLSSADIAIDME